ncbi:GumC family protein (plasmid) [Sphingomonas panni]
MNNQDHSPRGVATLWPPAAAQQPVPGYGQDYGNTAPDDSRELSLALMLRVMMEWRWLILAAIAAGLGLAIIATLLTTPVYRSIATIELTAPTVQAVNSDTEAPVKMDDSFIGTQIGLMKSRALAERVVQDLNLTANAEIVGDVEAPRQNREKIAIGVLQRNLDVKAVLNSKLITLRYKSTDPALAAKIVNGFADGFISTSLERRYQSSAYARNFLQRQIANVRRDLEKSERQLVGYAQNQGIINTNAGTGGTSDASSLSGASLIELNQALSQAQAKRIQAEQEYREGQSTRNTAEIAERTAQLRGQRATLQAEYQEKSNLFKADYPEMVQLASRIKALDQAIQAEARNVQTGRSGTLAAQYQAAAAAENALRARVEQLRGDVLNLRGRSIQYNILQRDVDTNRTLYDALLQRYKEIGVAGGIGVSYAAIADRGEIPSGPFQPNLLLNLVIGFGLGLALGTAIALALEFLHDVVKSPADVRERLKLAFLGGIPTLKGNRPVEALRDLSSPMSEAYFSAGTSISFTTDEGAPRSLLITSTRPAEGKSTTSWAIAQFHTRHGRRVLLIDADMRKPTFVTGSEKKDGLSTLLTTRDDVSSHVVQTDIPNLWLLPCGPIPPNPAELLSSPRMKAIIEEAVGTFDTVVVDGPPILGLADAPLLSTLCQGTLMVVESGKTRTRGVVEALGRMRSAGANIIGCILTRYHNETTYSYSYDADKIDSIEQRNREIRAIRTS